MPIRAQCDNCGKVYNLPDESGGKRLRCKQCAVAFTVPAATAPAEAPTLASPPSAPQKICVVCGQNVAGRPRTKDQAGNYYCRSCYEEKARSREHLAQSRVGAAVPAGVGGGGGDDNGEMIDLAALEPTEQEQFDESTQPPPPPIPDMDYVAPPIPNMNEEPMMAEPVVEEAPKPKKKKKKKKVEAKASSGGSFMAILGRVPIELWVLGISILVGIVGVFNAPAANALFWIGLLCFLWAEICLVLAAYADSTVTGLLYLFIPFYSLYFIISNWSDVNRYVLRAVLGVAILIGAAVVQVKHEIDDVRDELQARDNRKQKNFSTDSGIKLTIDLEEAWEDEEESVIDKREKDIADAIMNSFKQRGVKPPEGTQLQVEAIVEMSDSATQTISLSKDLKEPAPILICKLRVKAPSDTMVFDQSKTIELPPDAISKAQAQKEDDEEDIIGDALWKDVPREFATLAAQVPVDASAANNATSTPGNQTPAANNQTPVTAPAAAETPAEETIRIGVRFHQMLPNGRVSDGFFGDPEKIEPWKDAIENTILTSLQQRGIKPPEGQYYSIEAVVEENWSSVQKIKMANGEEAAAPILICKMRVKDSVGRGSYIFDMGKDIELPADVLAKASRSRLSTVRRVSFIDEALWKPVLREFKAMTDQFQPEGAAAPKVPAKTAAPTENPPPSK